MTEACNYYSISVTAPILTRCHNRAANYYRPCCRVANLARVCNIVATQAFPFPVFACVVVKKELRRGGSQLKRISAPAVHSCRAIFESPHHLDILNATPFPLHRPPSPLPTCSRYLFLQRASYSHPRCLLSFYPSMTTKRSSSSSSSPFHERGNCSSIDRQRSGGFYCLSETYLAEILSLDSGSGRVPQLLSLLDKDRRGYINTRSVIEVAVVIVCGDMRPFNRVPKARRAHRGDNLNDPLHSTRGPATPE